MNLQPLEVFSWGFLLRGEKLRFFIALFVCMCMIPAYADDLAYDKTDFIKLTDFAEGQFVTIQAGLQDLESEIGRIEPGFIARQANKSDAEKLVAYRSLLARKSFDWYKDYFYNRLLERSVRTGREIKENLYGNGKHKFIYLDDGGLMEGECLKNGRQICPYPDGHEEVYLCVQDYDSSADLFFVEDDKDRNITQGFNITLSNNGGKNFIDMDLSIVNDQSSYTEYAAYREKDRAYNAQFAGITNDRQRKIFKRMVRSGKIVEVQMPEEIPATVVFGYTFSFEQNSRQANE